LGIKSIAERKEEAQRKVGELEMDESTAGETAAASRPIDVIDKPGARVNDAPLCYSCGSKMQPAGSCYVCSSCGSTSGCS
jgi:ribonucleoside-diphosphate reductase alpha chain